MTRQSMPGPRHLASRTTTKWLVFLFCSFIFEGVFVVPLDRVREGARLQFVHFALAAGGLLFIMRSAWTRSIPKISYEFIALILFFTYGFLVAQAWPGYNYALFLYALILMTFVFYFAVMNKVVANDVNLFLAPMRALSFLFLLALIDWGLSFKGFHLPELIDHRQHQEFAGLPRFEAFSPLSLGAAYWLVIFFFMALARKKWFLLSLALLMLGLTLSSGVLIAFVLSFGLYCFISARGFFSRSAVLLLGLAVALIAAFAVAQAKSDTWSSAERLSYYLFLPEFLSAHPLGVGLGGSRFLSDYFEIPMLLGGTVDHDNSESSFLDLAYEFGVPGIGLYLSLLAVALSMSSYAIRQGGGVMVVVFINIFVLIHAFFNPSYFSQPRYLLAMMMMLTLRRVQRRQESNYAPHISTDPTGGFSMAASEETIHI